MILGLSSQALGAARQQALVDEAVTTIEDFKTNATTTFINQLSQAKAVVIMPGLIKAGLIIGGEGGRAEMMGRAPQAGTWSYPAFFSVGSASFGLQAGVKVSEMVLIVRTEKGFNKLLSDKVKLGADAGITILSLGTETEAATTTNVRADILAFGKSKGIFGGFSLEGALLLPEEDWNAEYYGKPVTTAEIVKRGMAQNPNADPLRRALQIQ